MANAYSKKYKLARKYWFKGTSKFLFCRLTEERLMEKKNIKQIPPLEKIEPYIPRWKKIINKVKKLWQN